MMVGARFSAGESVMIAIVGGPAVGEIVRSLDVACGDCGGIAYLCRTDCGQEFNACESALMRWDGED
jgi:hypothetical protein